MGNNQAPIEDEDSSEMNLDDLALSQEYDFSNLNIVK